MEAYGEIVTSASWVLSGIFGGVICARHGGHRTIGIMLGLFLPVISHFLMFVMMQEPLEVRHAKAIALEKWERERNQDQRNDGRQAVVRQGQQKLAQARKNLPPKLDVPHYREHKINLFRKQGGLCNGCEKHFELKDFQVDHVYPRSKGGSDHVANLQLLCQPCNASKGDRDMGYLKHRAERMAAYSR